MTVNYASVTGTATSPADYGAVSGTLTFVPGDTSETITVPVVGDLLDEDNENYTIALSSPANATFGDNLALGTITDNDAEPTVSVGDVSVTEGNSGTVDATFNVTLSAASGRAAHVVYETAEGTASGTLDFVTEAFFLDFAAGETSKTVTIQVIGDALDEANETFFLKLTEATNATLGDAEGVGTINDNDAEPTLSVGDVTVTEGNAGTTVATFTVGLSAISGQDVSVAYATANVSAVAPADYAATAGTLNFPAGDTSKTVTVNVNGDVLDEANESFFLNLTAPSHATLADGQAVGTITDDDAAPSLSINDATQLESAPNATFTVSLSAASGQTVTVNYATVDGLAIAPGDYTATTGLLTFTPGQTSKTVDVALIGDARDEINESFTVEPLRRFERHDRRRPGPRHDHGRRSRAFAVGQRRHRHRGQLRHGERDLHGHALRGQRPPGVGQLRDRQQLGGGPGRLRRGHGLDRLPGWSHDEDRHRARQRGHARRERREFLPHPVQCLERNSARFPRTRDDH